MNRRLLTGAAAGLGMMALILDGKTALAGAAEGVQLCVQAIVPSLFPFFFLTGLLTASLLGEHLTPLLPLGKWLGFPPGAESLLICAFLGGYPSGAQTVAQAWKNGYLSKASAVHLLRFCNNAGPSFIFGMLLHIFPDRKSIWILWGIQMLSAFLVGSLFSVPPGQTVRMVPKRVFFSQALNSAIRGTVLVCGWVILFRILMTFLDRWFLWRASPWLRILTLGLLEITNGCLWLDQLADPRLRFLLCSGMLCFGGLCVTMQTICVTDGLPIRPYLEGKLTQSILCLLLSLGLAYRYWWIIPVVGVVYGTVRKKIRKSYRNSLPYPV